MKTLYLSGLAILFCLQLETAFAYGSSSSSSSCKKPSFSEFKPAANESLQSFREFSFVASSNTSVNSIEVSISAGSTKEHFTAKQLEITEQSSGRLKVKGKPSNPFQPGFVRINVKAHSKPGCNHSDGVLIRVQ